MKRFLSIILLCVLFLSVVLFCFSSLSVYAATDFTEQIKQNKTFYVTGSDGKSYKVYHYHALIYADDDACSYFFQGYVYSSVKELNSVLQLFCASNAEINTAIKYSMSAALGLITGGKSALITNALDSLDEGIVQEHITVDDAGNCTYDSTAVTAIKEQLEKQYYDSIGMSYIIPKPASDAYKINETFFSCDEDKNAYLSGMNSCDYFVGPYNRNYFILNMMQFNLSSYSYCVYEPYYSDVYSLAFYDGSLKTIAPPVTNFSYGVTNSKYSCFFLNGYPNHWQVSSDRFIVQFYDSSADVTGSTFGSLYSSKHDKLFYFKSYEAMYNYVHGSQTAYLTSQFQQAASDMTIKLDEIDDNLGTKLDSVVDAINNTDKSGMSADDLQNLIDEHYKDLFESINDNTGATNTILSDIKDILNDILDVLKDQNASIKQLVGITSNIQQTTENIEQINSANLSANMRTNFDKVVEKSKSKFPTCVPWDLWAIYGVLAADPQPPKFTFNYGFMIQDGPSFVEGAEAGSTTAVVIDFSKAQKISDVSRGVLSLIFVFGLIKFTSKIFGVKAGAGDD